MKSYLCALGCGLLAAVVQAQGLDPLEDLQGARVEKSALEAQLAGLPAREDALSQELTREVRTLFRLRRGGLLPLVSGLEAMLGHASRVAHYQKLTGRTLLELERVRAERDRLGHDALALDARIAAGQEALLDRERGQQQLAQAAAERTRMESLAAASDQRPSYGLTLAGGADALAPGERFTDMVGSLALPVAGSASISEAERPGDEGTGLAFGGKPGASVRAAAPGRVAFAERQSQYGLLVIVEHDHRYRTVYGGLASIDVQVGDAISKSARIGTSGDNPVYFEVRRDSRSQDARRWLGL
jgi:murein hydrolase activator